LDIVFYRFRDIATLSMKIACFPPPHTFVSCASGGTPSDIINNAIYAPLKSTLNGIPSRQYGSIFIRLAVVCSQIREIQRNSERVWPYIRSRSSKFIDILVWIESAYANSY